MTEKECSPLPPPVRALLKNISFTLIPGFSAEMLRNNIDSDTANDEIMALIALLSKLTSISAEECMNIHKVIAKYQDKMEYSDGIIINTGLEVIAEIAENAERIEKWYNALTLLGISFTLITAALTSSPFPDNNSKS